jgi:WD40 repeat protein
MDDGDRFPDGSTHTEGETLDMPEGMQSFTPGQVLGERYQILEMLGRGGMGEVWQAFDLKLRVEVALKALRPEFFKSERRLELLRQEVRAAREVMSPNVCRIFDLIEIEGRELVSMEYVDGATLLGVLKERGPLDLKEAQDIASQFLAGLEAIHKVGLIHRDIKPENIMLTRAGRVVVMDFGLARQEAEGGGSVSGTPAYMAPEQAAGQTLDPRADVYAAGVVLAEMVSPEGIKSYESRQSVWEGVRSEPAKLPDSPWAPVLKKAVAKDREGRYNTARTLTRALEDVTLRVEGAEDLHPYPGLASFTEEDAEYFFGREAEVEQMWRRLEGPARMLSLVGPSGAGKSSFVRAGLLPARHQGWDFLVVTPGEQPFVNLGGAITRALAGDLEALELMVRFAEPEVALEVFQRWRRQHEHALLVVDQFEELFTLNPEKTQTALAGLLGRLPLEADVHVLVSMRDDFLGHCHEHSSLTPMFSDLTYLGTPAGGALRRAVVRPATKCGYRFEDDELVEEMLGEVEGERGALPMLAFALARLWENRDRETGLLTRQAYHDVGGVGGALAQHAEATIDRIGAERVPIVRELFRNLVTAEGTRAVREWGELLSVFDETGVDRAGVKPAPTTTGTVGAGFIPAREAAEEVLRELIDARLLTSYEVKEEDREPTRRVEIIHESLLANWPRLVRWQTQDADAAQLRDQLRQAAKTWDDQGRSDDTLWTGSAYREFAVWREGYPGGLTETEEAFASAMILLATRRRRRRRIAVTTIIVALLTGLAVVGTFWRRSVLETRRAEAAKLLALAQVDLETDPTQALAYATSSLELADTYEARMFVTRALWAAPPVQALDLGRFSGAQFQRNLFSPDGRWLVVSPIVSEDVLVFNEHGGEPIVLGGHKATARGHVLCGWTRDGLLVTGGREGRARIWSMPDGQLVNEIMLGTPPLRFWSVVSDRIFTNQSEIDEESGHRVGQLRSWDLRDGERVELGEIDWTAVDPYEIEFDPGGKALIYTKADAVYARPLPIDTGQPDRLLARHSAEDIQLWIWGRAEGFFSTDSAGEIILWNSPEGISGPSRLLPKPETATTRLLSDPSGRWAFDESDDHRLRLWDRAGMTGANPWVLRRRGSWILSHTDFHPNGKWVVATTDNRREVSFWSLASPRQFVADGWRVFDFTPDSRYVVAVNLPTRGGDWATQLRLWPLPGTDSAEIVDVALPSEERRLLFRGLTVGPKGKRVLTRGYGRSLFVIPLGGGAARRFEGYAGNDVVDGVGFSPSGRLVAAATTITEGQAKLRVWNLETDEVRAFDQPDDPEGYEGYYAGSLAFLNERIVYTAGANGLLRWDVETGSCERLRGAPPGGLVHMGMSADRQKMITFDAQPRRGFLPDPGSVRYHDLVTGHVRRLEVPGDGWPVLNADGSVWASNDDDGTVWVGRTDGGMPHALLGHVGTSWPPLVSPDLRWVVSDGQDQTLRLWPMPDLEKPPLHTLPHDELIAKLHSLTNIRVVRDELSSTGWKVEVGPFPGWATVPTW